MCRRTFSLIFLIAKEESYTKSLFVTECYVINALILNGFSDCIWYYRLQQSEKSLAN